MWDIEHLNVTSVTEELNYAFNLILINLHLTLTGYNLDR